MAGYITFEADQKQINIKREKVARKLSFLDLLNLGL